MSWRSTRTAAWPTTRGRSSRRSSRCTAYRGSRPRSKNTSIRRPPSPRCTRQPPPEQWRTSFFMVLIPERMAILDTERALEMFDALGLQMAGLIVNQVYPAELAEAKGGEAVEFLRNRARMQRKYLDEIKSKFAGKVVAMLPMYP